MIGYENSFGDPIFIDRSEAGFLVYTATHGEGAWNPKPIAVSLEAFGRAVSTIADAAKEREDPVALENNPLTQSEKDNTLSVIGGHNPGIDLEFWEIPELVDGAIASGTRLDSWRANPRSTFSNSG